MSIADFLHMGGYALYVWSSYGLALLVLGGNLIAARRKRSKLLREIRIHLQDSETTS
jgi:heme exporter protein D